MLDITERRAALLLHPNDNVWIACRDIRKDELIKVGDVAIIALSDVPVGHKLAFCDLSAGEKIMRYGAPIGSLTQNVAMGGHVHTQNLKSDYLPSHDRAAVELGSERK